MSQTVEHTIVARPVEDPTIPKPSNTTVKQDFGTSLSNAVRDNPASAALIGMGVAWMFFGGSKTSLFGAKPHRDPAPRHTREHDDYEMRFEPVRPQARHADRFGRAASNAGGTMRDAAGSVGSDIAGGASQVADAAASGYDAAASYVGDAASYIGSSAYDASRAGSRMVRSQAGHVQQTVGEFFEDKPLALGVLGLALGAGVAALLPKTDLERDYLGETSDQLKQQARALAGEKLGEAKELASTALDEAAREAEAQGLTKANLREAAADVKDRVAHVAQTATATIKDEAGRAS